nr:exosome complex component RRP43-like [Ipomoea batatas]
MAVANGSGDFSSKMELDAFRHLFPMQFHDSHHAKSIRPDAREIREARYTTVVLGSVASADGSALVKIGSTTMLAAIKMEIMTPTAESPDEGSIAVEFHMPPICSPMVRPGRPADTAPVISKQLLETITSSGMIDLKELCLFSGKAAWMAYLDIYCLDADGALFDAALLSAVAAFSHLRIPIVSLNDDGRVVLVPKNKDKNDSEELKGPANKEEKRKLKLKNVPFSLTCVLHKSYIIADPTAEEESLMETVVTVVLDSSYQLLSLYKPGGPAVANTSAIQGCVTLAWQRINELKKILHEAISDMEVD